MQLKNQPKKHGILAAILALTISAVPLAGCANARATADDGDFRILTSFYPMWLATINVAHDIPGVAVENMTEPQTGCLHDYSLTPRDMEAVGEADVLVINGGGMESFMERIAAQYPELDVVTASEGIAMLPGSGEAGEETNPHVWVGVSNAMKQVETIAAALAKADPAHADAYAANAKAYIGELSDLEAEMHAALDPFAGSPIITFHEAFPYFAAEFGLDIVAVIEREPGSEPSPKELADTIALIGDKKVKGLFAEPQYSAKAAETLSNETGIVLDILDPVVTGDADPAQRGRYIELMRANAETLSRALSR